MSKFSKKQSDRILGSIFSDNFSLILKNKSLLIKEYNIDEKTIDEWPFWLFEQNINIMNSIKKATLSGFFIFSYYFLN